MKQSMLCPPPVEDNFLKDCITSNPINLVDILGKAHHPGAGGIVIFSGEVRDNNNGRSVAWLEYESEITMAGQMIRQIIAEATEKWDLKSAFCIHRIGKLNIGESAVIVITAHKHRKEAYAANEYIIDRVKHEVPIWKKEVYSDGTHSWGNNCSCH